METNELKCRIARGYDTNVKIYPNEVYTVGKAEQSRTVTVTCTYHHNSACKSFNTACMTGAEIARVQKEAFGHCFSQVESDCRNMIELESMTVR